MKASEFDKRFDSGESIIDSLDLNQIKKPNLNVKRVNIDFPVWIIKAPDKEAKRIGVTRQAIIKMWIAEHLKHPAA
jgi:hypothetical protein